MRTYINKQRSKNLLSLSTKLWIYTNFDCNIRCAYCVSKSHPKAPRRALNMPVFKKIVNESLELGFEEIYLTGGEPLILKGIFEMLAFSSARLPTTVLTNAMMITPIRLEKLKKIENKNILIQVSLDGSKPEHHDPYRGQGSFQKTIEGIHRLIKAGFHIRLSTTVTPTNMEFLEDICVFCRSLGISEEDHIIRKLTKRGFSNEGREVGINNLIPEMTISNVGVYWHPLSTDPDFLVRDEIFPLSRSVSLINEKLNSISNSNYSEMEEYH